MKTPIALAGLLLVLGSGLTALPRAGADAGVAESFTLAPGESRLVAGSGLRLVFREVTGDSRCPEGAQCIRAGEVSVRIALSGPGPDTVSAELTLPGDAVVSHAGYRIELAGVTPRPTLDNTPAADEYRAHFRVSD